MKQILKFLAYIALGWIIIKLYNEFLGDDNDISNN